MGETVFSLVKRIGEGGLLPTAVVQGEVFRPGRNPSRSDLLKRKGRQKVEDFEESLLATSLNTSDVEPLPSH